MHIQCGIRDGISPSQDPLNGDLRMRRRVEPCDQFFTHSHKLCCYDVIPVVMVAIVRTIHKPL